MHTKYFSLFDITTVYYIKRQQIKRSKLTENIQALCSMI